MQIFLSGAHPSRKVSPNYFTGVVWQDVIMDAPAPAQVRAVRVSFEPGARTAWHTHPLGQTLHILSGLGRIQVWGEPVREIRPGDTIWIPPGEKHWHGAAPSVAMVHIAMHEAVDGVHVHWQELVSDDDYAAMPIALPVAPPAA